MRFDSDSPAPRSPYSGRHRKEPSFVRAARHIRLRPLIQPPTRTTPARSVAPLRIVTPPNGE